MNPDGSDGSLKKFQTEKAVWRENRRIPKLAERSRRDGRGVALE